ncbi:hypothetical protein [Pseudomonas sp. 9.1(2019)]|uniref:hypothetical protein n=1 Tax=Pseudomonas sp. 9.1(2019) TaxID=2580568 RepID=UPI001367D2FD|nr:hypothetical protein [Pseudomonas sp. 9.1(2019)]NBG94094.1 hypothetical protein [Pseudomonas sp. 9.1(2019)]
MSSYIVCYEGDKVETAKIEKALDVYNVKAQITSNVWIVVTEDGAADVRGNISKNFSGRIAVFKTDRAAAWRNIMCDGQWIKDNLS